VEALIETGEYLEALKIRKNRNGQRTAAIRAAIWHVTR
jgi:hypothetical protein